MLKKKPYIVNTIAELHKMLSLPAPEHPSISVINLKDVQSTRDPSVTSVVFNFYSIWLEKDVQQKIRYGQSYFDFDEGVMIFIAPGQILSTVNHHNIGGGIGLAFHRDFIKEYSLAKKIKTYGYFSYAVNEALHLASDEEVTITTIMRNIVREYRNNIDNYTQEVIISHIELLLNYCNRFYGRQFRSRRNISNALLIQMEEKLASHFEQETLSVRLPTVKFLAEQLHISPGYLSDMLREMTGQNTQHHIHNKLIEKAKELLVTTKLSTGEIAYRLGFEHSQSFSRLFKQKTKQSPTEFRDGFI